jgi:sugar lactone lactonase YvrE
VDPAGAITVLAQEADGVPFGFADDVDVARDGRIYFSDASSKFGPAMKARDDIMEHGGHGRLLRHDPASGTTEVLLDGLQFANGVALSRDEDFVLVNETGSYRITRYWLKGERAGTHDVFFDNLPGFPDGISANGRGTFWVALYSPRNAALDAMSDKPLVRKIAFRLPEMLQPQPERHAFVLGLDENATVTHNLQGTGPGTFAPVTSAEQSGDTLFLGSLTEPRFAAHDLTEAP